MITDVPGSQGSMNVLVDPVGPWTDRAWAVPSPRIRHRAVDVPSFFPDPAGLFMSESPTTVEPQYELLFRVKDQHGIARFGLMANESWARDPKRTLFTLARYKFVARMLQGRRQVLEVGCADAFGTRLVQQTVGAVTVTDIDPVFIDDARERMDPAWPYAAFVHDLLAGPVPGRFDAAYAMDVLEHIDPAAEDAFVRNLLASMLPTGVVVLGMPSLESQVHASPQSKAGHVNCKSGDAFKAFMERYFNTVFVFSMNDEVVHTGFYRMAHYLIAVGCHIRDEALAR
jgi:2-polyprenyl-3-methyl-5-hydroxy-6-metoxy-1,4-benzoquinol methylase